MRDEMAKYHGLWLLSPKGLPNRREVIAFKRRPYKQIKKSFIRRLIACRINSHRLKTQCCIYQEISIEERSQRNLLQYSPITSWKFKFLFSSDVNLFHYNSYFPSLPTRSAYRILIIGRTTSLSLQVYLSAKRMTNIHCFIGHQT